MKFIQHGLDKYRPVIEWTPHGETGADCKACQLMINSRNGERSRKSVKYKPKLSRGLTCHFMLNRLHVSNKGIKHMSSIDIE